MKYPVFAIIYNWKGLKEENYLYTAEELKVFDKELYEQCVANPNEWHDSSLADCAWKTWMGKLIQDEADLRNFLHGNYNETHKEDEDWYWGNMTEDNDLYGEMSTTMQEAINELLIYEVTELCAYCGEENALQWDIKTMGYVTECKYCGKKLMLCDECMHADDNQQMYCDWCDGKCFRCKN